MLHEYSQEATGHMLVEKSMYQWPQHTPRPTNMVCVDIKHNVHYNACDSNVTVMGVGTSEGYVLVHVIEADTHVIQTWRVRAASAITSVALFHWGYVPTRESVLDPSVVTRAQQQNNKSKHELCLCVGTALEGVFVYSNIMAEGLSQCVAVRDSAGDDMVQCVHPVDFDFDGTKELVCGTFGRHVRIYRRT